MLDESETLEAVFSFLAQFDLPTELTGLDNANDHEVPRELLPSTSNSPIQNVSTFNAETTELESLFALDTKVNDERSTSPASSEDSTQQLREGSKTKRPKKARISRKHQIETLREEIQDLNAELQTLARHRQCSGLQIPRSESLWEEIAHRQLERR